MPASEVATPEPALNDRRLVIAGLLGAGLCLAGQRALADEAPPPFKKLTKAQLHYQDSPKDNRSCATCSFFQSPKTCAVMEGDVAKTGYCDVFSLVD